jgi:hypothetical protein
MILLLDNVVWVVRPDGCRAPFDVARLAASIRQAAALTGHTDWWLADVVATAVHEYALDCIHDRVVGLGDVVDVVVELLAALGYREISEAYTQRQRRAEVRLDELAATTDAACELVFFRQLDGALGAAADEQLSLLQVCGLRPCVLRLRGAQRWNEGCRRLAEDIVSYVRTRVERLRPPQAATLRLAVSE